MKAGVQLNVEAGSVNCSLLGPITADDPEFALFVDGVVNEMTSKAGQKRTAIQQIIVPDPMTEAVRTRLDKAAVGDPRHAHVRMGPSSQSVTATRSARQSSRWAPPPISCMRAASHQPRSW
ncbi:aldehyde dehydrogenase family protein [Kribbella deserti]|uniref:Aldehyde dehydrogenase family protein n=1 Tax=Kribbella deserti TaxID=1926257 RepID=A0ABV6QXM8_9ACTN